MRNKFITAQEAAAMIHDGDFLMVGGFMGHGSPDAIIQAMLDRGVKDQVVASNYDALAPILRPFEFRLMQEEVADCD